MAKANDGQIGGTHYRPGVKLMHWDVVDKYCGYLEGYGSKYIMRWRVSPTPLKDIQKSIHIFTKILECYDLENRGLRDNNEGGVGVPPSVLRDFYAENKVEHPVDRQILTGMLTWNSSDDLLTILASLQELLPKAKLLQERLARSHIDNTGQRNVRGYVHSEEEDGR